MSFLSVSGSKAIKIKLITTAVNGYTCLVRSLSNSFNQVTGCTWPGVLLLLLVVLALSTRSYLQTSSPCQIAD